MATVLPVATPIVGGYAVMWQSINAGDTCIPWPCGDVAYPSLNVDASALTDRSVQVFAGGGSVHIQGSNAFTHIHATSLGFHTLNDAGSNALTLSTSSIKQVLEHTLFIRPAANTGVSNGAVLLKATVSTNRY